MKTDRFDCPESAQTLLLAAGELSEAEVAAAAQHADSCGECRELWEAYREVGQAYSGLESPGLEPTEVEAILGRVFAGGSPPGEVAFRSGASRWRRVAGLATAAGIVLAGSVVVRMGSTEQAGPAPAEVPVGALVASPFERLAALQQLVKVSAPEDLDARLLDIFENESSPNVRLAVLDALGEVASVEDPRVLTLIPEEPLAPLRIDLLALAARNGLPGTAVVAARLAETDGSGSVRARAASILGGI